MLDMAHRHDYHHQNGPYRSSSVQGRSSSSSAGGGANQWKINRDNFGIPLPFGYHMDLDFLRYCSQNDLRKESGNFQRMASPRNSARNLQQSPIPQRVRRVSEQNGQSSSGYYSMNNNNNYEWSNHLQDTFRPRSSTGTLTSPPPNLGVKVASEILDREELKSAFSDFETWLHETKTSPNSEQNSNHRVMVSPVRNYPRFSSPSTPSSPQATNNNSSTMVIDTNTMTLKNIRGQLSKSLTKMQSYEKQLEAIPALKDRVSALTAQNRILVEKLEQAKESRSRNRSVEVENRANNYNNSGYMSDPEACATSFYWKGQVGGGQSMRRHVSERSIEINDVKPKRSVACNTDPMKEPTPPPPVIKTVSPPKPITRNSATDTESLCRKMNRGVATNPPPRKLERFVMTNLRMEDVLTPDVLEERIRLETAKTEEEILGCPLLQKAMGLIERGELDQHNNKSKEVEMEDAAIQVGLENLRPFTVNVGLQCRLEEDRPIVVDENSIRQRILDENQKIVRTIGVGDCKIIEDPADPTKFRDIGICTEKWIETIKASKQTDTEDFAFKDTESPRVSELFDVSRSSPSPVSSRRSSYASQSQQNAEAAVLRRKKSRSVSLTKPKGKDMQTQTKPEAKPSSASLSCQTEVKASRVKSAQTEPPPPIPPPPKPEPCKACAERKESDSLRLKLQPSSRESSVTPKAKIDLPSPDQPWVSKIPRPVTPLKSASSFDSLASGISSSTYTRALSPAIQRSKSTLTASALKKTSSLGLNEGTRNLGTPPPHPNPSPSPLTTRRSPMMSRSLTGSSLPKSPYGFNPNKPVEKGATVGSNSNTPSMIPQRIATPPALRKMFPKDGADKLAKTNRAVERKSQGMTKSKVGLDADFDTTSDETPSDAETVITEKATPTFNLPGMAFKKDSHAPLSSLKREPATMSAEMKAALKVLQDAGAASNRGVNAQVTNAVNIVQQEWFKVSGTKTSHPLNVEEYLDAFEKMSTSLLARVVNMTDVNGNTALHYSVSHGNFDIVSVLLDSKVANPNVLNKAGYTCTMLISLAQVKNDVHEGVVRRLFSLGDVNVRASQHGQTALMLAVSHGRLDMVKLLVEAGADVNVQDEDGSTALMCAAEHGHMDIVKFVLQTPDVNVLCKDNDGLNALAVAMEAGHRDVGVVIYAAMSFSRGNSPRSSLRIKKSNENLSSVSGIPRPGGITPTPPTRTRSASSKR